MQGTDESGAASTAEALNVFIDRLLSGAIGETMNNLVATEFSLSQIQTICALHCYGKAMSIHQLAEALGLSVAAAGRGVDKLVHLGMVDRREDEHDRRIKRVSLTELGIKTVADHFTDSHNRNHDFVKRLPEELRAQLDQVLGQILFGDYLRPAECATAHEKDQTTHLSPKVFA